MNPDGSREQVSGLPAHIMPSGLLGFLPVKRGQGSDAQSRVTAALQGKESSCVPGEPRKRGSGRDDHPVERMVQKHNPLFCRSAELVEFSSEAARSGQ